MANQTYYILESKYVGPQERLDAHTVCVTTSPGRLNMSQEVATEGWLGTTSDFAVYAHGQYSSLPAALTALRKLFPDTRDTDVCGQYFDTDDDDVVTLLKVGRYHPMTVEGTAEFIWSDLQDIEGASEAEQVALLEACAAAAHSEGWELHPTAADMIACACKGVE